MQPINSVYKMTALYLRLSNADENKGDASQDSNSITNQKAYLLRYAERHNFKNIQIFIDDGISGVTMKRNAFQKLIDHVYNNEVATIIVKDMSRLGRNYIEMGQLMDYVFPQHNVRLIALTDAVDTEKGEDDFAPFRNIINELYAKDISKKVRSALKSKSRQGFAIGLPPYGYMRSKDNPRIWVVDDEAAEVVKRIFKLRKERVSLPDIAKALCESKIHTPSYYAYNKGFKKSYQLSQYGEYWWDKNAVRKILLNISYTGDIVNFKTTSKSFKLKERIANEPENWEVHKGVHEAIVSYDDFEIVQQTFAKSSTRKPKHCEKNMFAGYLFCADCGAPLHHKYRTDNPNNTCFTCRNYKSKNGLCNQTHHIRVDDLTEFVKSELLNLINFANIYEDDFVRIVVNADFEKFKNQQSKSQNELKKAISRYKEIDLLFGNLYEDKITGEVSAEVFKKLIKQYEVEQKELEHKIEQLNMQVKDQNQNERDTTKFLQLVRKYTQMQELNFEIIQEFIEKIVVEHREIINGVKHQKVHIYYKCLGRIEIPNMTQQEHTNYLTTFSRK